MERVQLKDGRVLTVRRVRKEDAEDVIEYLHRICRESDYLTFGPGELTITVKEEESRLEATAKAENQLMLVALVDGKIAGSVGFTGGGRMRIRHVGEFGISVLRAYWGLGVGTYLLDSLIRWAKEGKVIRKINLRVRSDNERGINLYKKFGFAEEGVQTRDFFIQGKFYDSIRMGLHID